MVFVIILVLTCAFCEGLVGPFSSCCNCRKNVHTENCSISNSNNSLQESDRICLNCFCIYCKQLSGEGHNCLCHICSVPINIEEDMICCRCEKITHASALTDCCKQIRAFEKENELRFICNHCLYAQSNICLTRTLYLALIEFALDNGFFFYSC